MKKDYDIDIYEVDEGELSAAVMFEDFYLEINARVFVDEMENLWGDQVSSISMIAHSLVRVWISSHSDAKRPKFPKQDQLHHVFRAGR